MQDRPLVERYNYSQFIWDEFDVWLNFHASPPLNQRGPDFPLWQLDGQVTYLGQIWPKHPYTIVEFGSITCPPCKAHAAAMDEVAQHYSKQGAAAVFIYTHEVHPGENYPHLTSLERKLQHARLLRDTMGMVRPILLDSLDGACHRAYGSMPNMTWIFNQLGMAVYKSSGTDVASITAAIEHLIHAREHQHSGEQLRTILVESLAFQTEDPESFQHALSESGNRALLEHQEAVRDYLAYVA